MRIVTEKFLAEYFRLSVEDGDIISNDTKAESDSISHQRELITRYIRDKQLYPTIQPLEFVDDGYSGTNFDRPAVKEMLALVREGKICCIIVKDLSRFGRNYLEVGDYLEQIFPFMGVRFIAINDGYDSKDHIGTTGGIEISFKSLLYDMYSKDLSEKMRSSLLVRRKRGDFIGARAPFGYQFSDNKKVLAVDEVAAQYVRRIFGLANKGCGTGEIAKILNEEKIPTPGRYKNQEKQQYYIMDKEGYWDCGKVRKILQNKVYLGTVVNGKVRVTEVGGSHFRKVPDAEQICVPNMHKAIITEQEFLLASEVIKNNKGQKGKKHNQKEEKNRCISEWLSEPERDVVFPTMDNRQLRHLSVKEMKTMCMTLKQKQDSLKRKKQYLYEQYKMNQMDQRIYLKRVEALREEEHRLSELLQKMQEV